MVSCLGAMEGGVVASDNITILIGTTKGAFLISGGSDRSGWKVTGPHCDGWPINHLVGDAETGTIWAGGGGDWHGAGVWRSEDGGESWQVTRLTKGKMDDWAANDPDFARMIGWTDAPLPFGDGFAQIWSLCHAHGRLYAGTKPASLLQSLDGGQTWERIDALTEHPSAASWDPGAAGLVLHTILSDPANPDKLWIGISAAGVFATEDGGATWERRNRLSNAEPATARPPGRTARRRDRPLRPQHDARARHRRPPLPAEPPRRLALGGWRAQLGRHHRGPALDLRLSDPGASARPGHDLDPAAQRRQRRPLPAGRRRGGLALPRRRKELAGHARGLAAGSCFFTVLRQAMAGDARDPAGVYFGTNSGSVFASLDEGETWREVARHLPTILAVEVLDRAGAASAGVTASRWDVSPPQHPAGDPRSSLSDRGRPPSSSAATGSNALVIRGPVRHRSGEGSGSPKPALATSSRRRLALGRSTRAEAEGRRAAPMARQRAPAWRARFIAPAKGQEVVVDSSPDKSAKSMRRRCVLKSGREPKGSTRSRISPVRAR